MRRLGRGPNALLPYDFEKETTEREIREFSETNHKCHSIFCSRSPGTSPFTIRLNQSASNPQTAFRTQHLFLKPPANLRRSPRSANGTLHHRIPNSVDHTHKAAQRNLQLRIPNAARSGLFIGRVLRSDGPPEQLAPSPPRFGYAHLPVVNDQATETDSYDFATPQLRLGPVQRLRTATTVTAKINT